MPCYLGAFLISCLLALLLTPLLRRVAIRNGILDHPDERKVHKNDTPRVGGVAIVLAFFLAMGFVLLWSEPSRHTVSLVGLCIGGAIIAFMGVLDDVRKLSAVEKLFGQIVAVLLILPFGFAIRELNIPFIGLVDAGRIAGALLTVFWVVGITNTINLIDGMDGLAGGIVIITLSALFAISVTTGQLPMAVVCIALAGGVAGFLRYNFHPATIFMGDCGAMFLGFMISAISIKVLFQNPDITASCMIPVLILGLPVFDTTWAIMRRLKKRVSPFRADGLHTHHRLLNIGFSQRKSAVILYFIGSSSVFSGLIIAFAHSETLAVALSAFMFAMALVMISILNRISPDKEAFERSYGTGPLAHNIGESSYNYPPELRK